MENIKRIICSLFLMLICAFAVNAQTVKEIRGIVTDVNNDPLTGVSVFIKNQPTLVTATDINGRFKIKAGQYDILVLKYIGFTIKEVPVSTIKGEIVITMDEESQNLDEVVVTAGGMSQRKITLTGAISTVNIKTMKVPTGNISNALVGNVTGIIGRQTTGEPGENNTEFWIRGISTFGANAKALVLVDGIERSLDELNVEDIESFSVLKDASATAIYGSRGANGVLVINTKRGEAGKVNINLKSEEGYNTRSRTPEFTDGITYAKMVNEARTTRYQDPIYSNQDIEIIGRNLDTDLFPNVNWSDIVLKNGAYNNRETLSLSGGGTTARYYVSGSYFKEDGMYDTAQKSKKYSTNASYERYNYRTNVDLNITQTTLLKIGVGGYLTNETKPRMSSSDIWSSLSNLTPLTVPRMYSNGLIPTYGDGNTMNPEVQLSQTGYLTKWENKVETNVTLEQDLKSILSGLKLIGTFSFDTDNTNIITRAKNPELWYADRRRDSQGNLVMRRVKEASLMKQSSESSGQRRYYSELKLNYEKILNKDHRISSLLMYYQQEKTSTVGITDVVTTSIPYRNMALSGRLTYGYKDRYLTDFNFGYTGSENFEKGKRFGFFPAISAAWVISEEPFIQDNFYWLNMFKVRYSYGEVGNDQIASERFPYMSFITTSASYNWGEYGSNNVQGYRITTMGSSNLTWEKAQKHNLGVDLVIGNKFNATVDFFKDIRRDIFMQRSQMPYSTGLQDLRPYANIGEMESKGVDGTTSFTDKIGEVGFTLRGNFTYAKTNVINYDEADNALPYQMTKGYRLNQTRGLISLGLFENQEDIDTSPTQTFGVCLPGDIKYKDVNGDGLVNEKDVVPMGYTTVPCFVYGAGISLNWRAFDFNILFQGTGKSDFFISGKSVYPFIGSETGNILKNVTNPEDRWISREISNDPATENINAMLPRLSYGGNANNYRNSTYWKKDGSYLRMKNLEFGYNIPREVSRKFFAENVRVGFIGYNLLVFSAFDWWDPEIGSSDGAAYPISKTYSLNLTVNF